MGARWVVGNGEKIRIWKDKWLPLQAEFRAWSPVKILGGNATVNELIDSGTRQWKRDLIFECFNNSEAQQILNLPISYRLPQDNLIWHWESHGSYSVRSAYHLLTELRVNQYPSLSIVADQNRWKEIWHAPVPSKIRNLMWRVAKNILPTRFNLSKRGVEIEMLCPVCHLEVERVDHVLMKCQMARLVWFSTQLGIHVPLHYDLNKWMLEWLTCKDSFAVQIFCTTLWQLWARNNIVFNKKNFDPISVAAAAMDFVNDYNQANPKMNSQVLNAPQLGWSPLPESWTKINVDAGCFKDCFTGWGMLIRNHLGEVLFAATKKENLNVEPTFAEALGVRWSLILAKEQRLNKVIVESDAELVVNCINNKLFLAAIDPIANDCKALLQNFQDYVVCSAIRKANVAAHELAELAKIVGSRTWLGNAPSQSFSGL